MNAFNRSDHIYNSPNFEEIIKDTIRFFNGTPVHKLPPPERFYGTGVYAIYCVAKTGYIQGIIKLIAHRFVYQFTLVKQYQRDGGKLESLKNQVKKAMNYTAV